MASVADVLQVMEDLKKHNEDRLKELGESALHHPLYSCVHQMKRYRFHCREGDWIFVNENDGRTAVEFPLHISQVKIS